IQHNECYGNRTAGSKDGGGFDLDGGVTRSVLQYNYAHDNDGAGYLLAQFPGAPPFGGNLVRYNISPNDGTRNNYGGIHLAGDLRAALIFNNTVYMAPAPRGVPAAVRFDRYGTITRNIRFGNNIFETTGGVPIIDVPLVQQDLSFLGNDYFAG